jgi:PST family polysaccharide transporter
MSFKKTFFSNISTLVVYNYLTIGIEFLATIILSRLLLPDEYGFVAMINVFSSFVALFASIGIGTAVIRSDYGYTYHKHLASLAVWLGIALCLILSMLAYPIALFFNNTMLVVPTLVVSLKFILDAFNYIPIAILSKKLKFNTLGKTKLFSSSVQLIIMIGLAYAGFSYWALILPLLIQPVMQYLLLRKHVSMPFSFYGWKATRRMIFRIRSLMGNLSLTNLVGYWASNADKIIIGRMYTQSDLGLYNRGFRFLQISNRLITGVFSSVLLPSLKKLKDQGGDIQKEFMDIVRIITLFNFPLVFVLIVFPDSLVKILWGTHWSGVAPFLPYIAIIILFTSIIKIMNAIFFLYGKEKNLLLITLIRSILTILLVIAGGLISVMYIIQFITLGYMLITVPLNIYYGFYKSFRFKTKDILYFWIPAGIFGITQYIAIAYNLPVIKIIVLMSFFFLLVYDLRKTLIKGGAFMFRYTKKKFQTRKNSWKAKSKLTWNSIVFQVNRFNK